jgi:hypothetical protein
LIPCLIRGLPEGPVVALIPVEISP